MADKWKTESLMTDWQNDKLIYSKQFVCVCLRVFARKCVVRVKINGPTNGERQWNCFNAVGSFTRRIRRHAYYIKCRNAREHTNIQRRTYIKNTSKTFTGRIAQSKKASINKTLLFTVAHKFTCVCASAGCTSTFDIHSASQSNSHNQISDFWGEGDGENTHSKKHIFNLPPSHRAYCGLGGMETALLQFECTLRAFHFSSYHSKRRFFPIRCHHFSL